MPTFIETKLRTCSYTYMLFQHMYGWCCAVIVTLNVSSSCPNQKISLDLITVTFISSMSDELAVVLGLSARL